MKSGWKTYLLYGCLIVFGGLFIFLTYETYKANNMGFETKTYWDWMELLIIPLFLAGGVFYLNWSERKTEREIAKDRQQEGVLQSYLDQMSDLLLKDKLQTTKSREVSDLARIRTVTVLQILDGRRKRYVVQFLFEAQLIDRDRLKVVLFGSDLKDANLKGAMLRHTDLSGADLDGADLSWTSLTNSTLKKASLRRTNLEGANLEGASLVGADLERANLKDAILKNANLIGANITDEQLKTAASIEGATMPDRTKPE